MARIDGVEEDLIAEDESAGDAFDPVPSSTNWATRSCWHSRTKDDAERTQGGLPKIRNQDLARPTLAHESSSRDPICSARAKLCVHGGCLLGASIRLRFVPPVDELSTKPDAGSRRRICRARAHYPRRGICVTHPLNTGNEPGFIDGGRPERAWPGMQTCLPFDLQLRTQRGKACARAKHLRSTTSRTPD